LKRVRILPGQIINQRRLAPNLVLAMSRFELQNLLEILNRFAVPALFPVDDSELVKRVDFARVDLDRAFIGRSRRVEISALLIEQSQVVMSGGVGRIERRSLQILLKGRPRAMRAHKIVDAVAQQKQQQQQQQRGSAEKGCRVDQ